MPRNSTTSSRHFHHDMPKPLCPAPASDAHDAAGQSKNRVTPGESRGAVSTAACPKNI